LQLAGICTSAEVFATTYAGIGMALRRALDRSDPDVCLHLGLAPRARQVRIEVRAENRARPLSPDASGERPPQRVIVPSGPTVWRTILSVAPVVASFRRTGIAAAASRDAGAYLCNAVYGLSLEAARGRKGRLVLFVHIPRPAPAAGRRPSVRARGTRTRPRMDRLTVALLVLATRLAAQARAARVRPADLRS
jgi:pyroglutamyl-peptidase